jgi:hypothetical protein
MEVQHIEFSNQSRQYKRTPSVYAIPETPEDLQEIVRNNQDFPSPAVAVGSDHSNSGCNVMRKVAAVYIKKIHFIHEPTAK